MRSNTASGTLVFAALIVTTTLIHQHPAAADSCPAITRDEIISRAKSGVGSPYIYAGTCWDPQNRSAKGADCSGFVTKCWQIPSASPVTSCTSHFYNTGDYYYNATHWSAISRSALTRGDALVRRSGGSGHITLYEASTSAGCYAIYHARSSAYGIVHNVSCPGSEYAARRRHNLKTAPAPAPPPPPPRNRAPYGRLTIANCEQLEGWAYDPDAGGNAISVRVYIDSKPGDAGAKGILLRANRLRSELCDKLGSCNHGFALDAPATLRDGRSHTVRVFALDSAGGEKPELDRSPRHVSCGSPAAPDPVAQTPPPPSPPEPEAQPFTPADQANVLGGCTVGGARSSAMPLAALLLLAVGRIRHRPRSAHGTPDRCACARACSASQSNVPRYVVSSPTSRRRFSM